VTPPNQLAALRTRAPWKPGESGNVHGRPKKYHQVLKLARAATPEAVETLKQCMRDKNAPWANRVTAAGMLLDRAWGKPTQQVELDTQAAGPSLLRIEIVSVDGRPTETIEIPGVAEQPDPEPAPLLPFAPFSRERSDPDDET